MDCQNASIAKPSQVQEQVDELAKTLIVANETAERLEQRLESVLRPPFGDQSKEPVCEQTLCPLAAAIRFQNSGAAQIVKRLTEILARIEL